MAADLKNKGHRVTLLKTSDKLNNENFNKIRSEHGLIKVRDMTGDFEVTLDRVTNDFSEALTQDTELVVIFIQTNYHEQLVRKLQPYLHDGEMILLEPGYLSSLYFSKYCHDLKLTVIEAESSPLDCRLISPGEIAVSFRNVRNPISISPVRNAPAVLEKLETLQYHFVLLENAIEAALHNPNLIVHTIGAIMSIPRIEYSEGQYWMYKEVFTESIWNLISKLDAEKIGVLRSFKLPETSYIDACKFRNTADLTCDSREIFNDYAQNHSVKGPGISNSRYITEDVPEGLVLLESMGKDRGIETVVCTSLIDIASACLQIDFRCKGRTLEKLGKENFYTMFPRYGQLQ